MSHDNRIYEEIDRLRAELEHQTNRAEAFASRLRVADAEIERCRVEVAKLRLNKKASDMYIQDLREERDALRAQVEREQKGLKAVEDLMNESEGVYGFHLNGDLSPWEDFREGGCNEAYLMDFDDALRGEGGSEHDNLV